MNTVSYRLRKCIARQNDMLAVAKRLSPDTVDPVKLAAVEATLTRTTLTLEQCKDIDQFAITFDDVHCLHTGMCRL